MRDLISRDSFWAPEIEIFQAVCNWADHNKGQDPTPILEVVRLQLMGMHELLNVVRDTGLVSSDSILDAIKIQTESRDMELKYRGLQGIYALDHLFDHVNFNVIGKCFQYKCHEL